MLILQFRVTIVPADWTSAGRILTLPCINSLTGPSLERISAMLTPVKRALVIRVANIIHVCLYSHICALISPSSDLCYRSILKPILQFRVTIVPADWTSAGNILTLPCINSLMGPSLERISAIFNLVKRALAV